MEVQLQNESIQRWIQLALNWLASFDAHTQFDLIVAAISFSLLISLISIFLLLNLLLFGNVEIITNRLRYQIFSSLIKTMLAWKSAKDDTRLRRSPLISSPRHFSLVHVAVTISQNDSRSALLANRKILHLGKKEPNIVLDWYWVVWTSNEATPLLLVPWKVI